MTKVKTNWKNQSYQSYQEQIFQHQSKSTMSWLSFVMLRGFWRDWKAEVIFVPSELKNCQRKNTKYIVL